MKRSVFINLFGLNINFQTKAEKGIEFRISNFNFWLTSRVINTLVSYEGVGIINEDVEKRLDSIKKDVVTYIWDKEINHPLDDKIDLGSKEYNDALVNWMNRMYEKYSCDITCSVQNNDVNILVTVVRK